MPSSIVEDGADLWKACSGGLHDWLSSVIPAPLFVVMAGSSNLAYRLVLAVSNDPTSWTSTLLPPLIALIFAYFSLVLAYRTVRNTILVVWWGIKWGAVIGAAFALCAWWAGEGDVIRSHGDVPDSNSWLHTVSSLIGGVPFLTVVQHMLNSLGQRAASGGRQSSDYRSKATGRRNRTGRGSNGSSSSLAGKNDPTEGIYAAAHSASVSLSDSPFSRRRVRTTSKEPSYDIRPSLEELLTSLGVSSALIVSLTGGSDLPYERIHERINLLIQSCNAWLGQTWDDLVSGVSDIELVSHAQQGSARSTRSRARQC